MTLQALFDLTAVRSRRCEGLKRVDCVEKLENSAPPFFRQLQWLRQNWSFSNQFRMLFRRKFGRAIVTSQVERVSRNTFLLIDSNPTIDRVIGRLAKVMRTLPHKARKPVTFDRGSWFMDWFHLQAKVGPQSWRCDPSTPRRKATVLYLAA